MRFPLRLPDATSWRARKPAAARQPRFCCPSCIRLIDRPRRTTRALILTPTRELAAQILEDLNALAVHTPSPRRRSMAAWHGSAGARLPQRRRRDRRHPGRLLDHFKSSYAKLDGIEYLVLDEADRMLDMGFLPDIRRVLRHMPTKRQTLFFSATMPPPIAALAHEMLKNPERFSCSASRRRPSASRRPCIPVPQDLKPRCSWRCSKRKSCARRWSSRGRSIAPIAGRAPGAHGINAERIHGNRSQAQRTEALAGFKSGSTACSWRPTSRPAASTSKRSGHVVNFDVPACPTDYIHRVGRTGRAEPRGRLHVRVTGRRGRAARDRARHRATLPRVTLPDFDYKARAQGKLEIPLAERIAAIRARKG
jgi:ATP-dependent RNA helicase RhlE